MSVPKVLCEGPAERVYQEADHPLAATSVFAAGGGECS